jgi:hypothetical protein
MEEQVLGESLPAIQRGLHGGDGRRESRFGRPLHRERCRKRGKIKGTAHPMYDLMGKEVSLFRYTVHDGSPVGAQYVTQARQWFTTVWETISREFTG